MGVSLRHSNILVGLGSSKSLRCCGEFASLPFPDSTVTWLQWLVIFFIFKTSNGLSGLFHTASSPHCFSWHQFLLLKNLWLHWIYLYDPGQIMSVFQYQPIRGHNSTWSLTSPLQSKSTHTGSRDWGVETFTHYLYDYCVRCPLKVNCRHLEFY